MIAIIVPPPRKNISGALFIPKVPLETGAPQSFAASYAPVSSVFFLIVGN
jgi:hypothetical protein